MSRSLFALVLALGACTSPPAPGGSGATPTNDTPSRRDDREPHTRCESDGDCLMSCVEVDDCCSRTCGCDIARHYDDTQKIQAARRDCSTFDYTTCPSESCPEESFTYVPKCKRHRCVADKVEREPPPPPIDTSSYDLACTVDADCTLVQTQPCAKCGCASTPITTRDRARFEDAMSKVECPPYDPWPNITCGSCMEMQPRCSAGKCVAQ